MTEEEIKTMQAENAALKKSVEDLTKEKENLSTEKDSFKTENEKILKENNELKEDNKKLKETNYTLARHFDASKGAQKSPEDILNEMFK